LTHLGETTKETAGPVLSWERENDSCITRRKLKEHEKRGTGFSLPTLKSTDKRKGLRGKKKIQGGCNVFSDSANWRTRRGGGGKRVSAQALPKT